MELHRSSSAEAASVIASISAKAWASAEVLSWASESSAIIAASSSEAWSSAAECAFVFEIVHIWVVKLMLIISFS
jgi:hypothetical protein